VDNLNSDLVSVQEGDLLLVDEEGANFRLATVERITETQIVLRNSNLRFRRRDGRCVGLGIGGGPSSAYVFDHAAKRQWSEYQKRQAQRALAIQVSGVRWVRDVPVEVTLAVAELVLRSGVGNDSLRKALLVMQRFVLVPGEAPAAPAVQGMNSEG
jgi:hypothetical protein